MLTLTWAGIFTYSVQHQKAVELPFTKWDSKNVTDLNSLIKKFIIKRIILHIFPPSTHEYFHILIVKQLLKFLRSILQLYREKWNMVACYLHYLKRSAWWAGGQG